MVDSSAALIDDMIEKEGPFDGIIGFSQGGAMAHLGVLLKELGMLKSPGASQFKFIVMIGAFSWRWESLEKKLP